MIEEKDQKVVFEVSGPDFNTLRRLQTELEPGRMWSLDGVLQALIEDGYSKYIVAKNICQE